MHTLNLSWECPAVAPYAHDTLPALAPYAHGVLCAVLTERVVPSNRLRVPWEVESLPRLLPLSLSFPLSLPLSISLPLSQLGEARY